MTLSGYSFVFGPVGYQREIAKPRVDVEYQLDVRHVSLLAESLSQIVFSYLRKRNYTYIEIPLGLISPFVLTVSGKLQTIMLDMFRDVQTYSRGQTINR